MSKTSDFLFTTDYPIDQVVFLVNKSFVLPAGSYGSGTTITHNLPFRPLCMGNWSTDPSFLSTVYETNSEQIDSFGDVLLAVDVAANSSEISITGVSNIGTDKTIYVNIFCFAPSDWAGAPIKTTSIDSNEFVLNTDFNYSKLIKDGYIDIAQNNTANVLHSFGSIPQVLVWEVISGGYTRQQTGSFATGTTNNTGSGDIWYNVDENNLTIVNNSLITGTTRFYYRIYGD